MATKRKWHPKFQCIDCGKPIWARNRRCRECFRKARRGEGNPNWKGAGVTYSGIHAWVKNNKPRPVLCEYCHKNKTYEIANISGQYKRDITDFIWLCRSCHSKLHRGIEWHKWIIEFRKYKWRKTKCQKAVDA